MREAVPFTRREGERTYSRESKKMARRGGEMIPREMLERVEHELTTLHGLIVCDGFEAYHKAQRAGVDSVGAWDCFVEGTWQIDMQEILIAIKAALRKEGTGKEEE